MTPVLWMVLAFAVLLGGAAYGYEWWRTRPPLPPPPWITREEVEAMLAAAILQLPRDPRVTTEQFAEPGRFLVTGEHLAKALAERTERAWITAEEAARVAITETLEHKLRDVTLATLAAAEQTLVPRAELIPLVAAYCRKALDEGGELRARILALLPAEVAPTEVSRALHPEIATLVAKAVAADARLHAAARKHARPLRPAKKRGRR